MTTVGGDWPYIKLSEEVFGIDRNRTAAVENWIERVPDVVGFCYCLIDVRQWSKVTPRYLADDDQGISMPDIKIDLGNILRWVNITATVLEVFNLRRHLENHEIALTICCWRRIVACRGFLSEL